MGDMPPALEKMLRAMMGNDGDDEEARAGDPPSLKTVINLLGFAEKMAEPRDFQVGDFVTVKKGISFYKVPTFNCPGLVVKIRDFDKTPPSDEVLDTYENVVVAVPAPSNHDHVAVLALDERFLTRHDMANAIRDQHQADMARVNDETIAASAKS